MKEVERAKLVKVLGGEVTRPPPIWLMRQAGRYLPEYRALREEVGSFWAMSMTPEIACEVTLQPIARFGFDAAIVFSDILVVPYALGCEVSYEETGGPRLEAISSMAPLERDPRAWSERLVPCYEALRLVRGRLAKDVALLGFAGAPWTLATYMVQGGGSTDQRVAKLWGYREPEMFSDFLELIGDCVARHLIAQVDAGADAVQLFDSWASGLPPVNFRDWVIQPTRRIVEKLRIARPNVQIIGFPRGATLAGYEAYARETGVDVLSLDTAVPMEWAVKTIAPRMTVQGNLDPIALIAGGRALAGAVDRILDATEHAPFVFNLGHGVLPETPVGNVAELVKRVRGER